MKRLHLLRVLPVVLILVSVSCLFDPPSYPLSGDFEQWFQLFFENNDRLYTGFSVRPEVNWYALHDQYEARLDTVSSNDALMFLIIDLLSNLEDANITLERDIPDVSYDLYRTWVPDLYPNYDLALTYSLMEEWGGFTWVGETDSLFGYCFVTTDSIPYLIFIGTSFNDYEFDAAFEFFRYSPGMIVDVRMMSSGSLYSMDRVVKRFADVSRIVYYLVERNGPGHDDFSDPEQVRRSRRADWQFSTEPVILLAGECCANPAEGFVQMMRQYPNVTVIGDTTSGTLAFSVKTFSMMEYWYINFPVEAMLDTDYQFIDRVGVPPDTYVEATEADFQMGIDPIYDYALELLTN
jgi:hypothetical protein